MKTRLLFLIILIISITTVMSQNITITDDNGYSADSSAMLDVQSLTKGMLVPRMTTIQRSAIVNPATGLLVFDSNELSFFFYNGTEWIDLSTGVQLWTETGLNVHLADNSRSVGVGTNTPYGRMEVKGEASADVDDPIFQVTTAAGDTVFAVYPEGVRIHVDDNPAKAVGSKGGFAVGGFSQAKGKTNEFFRVTPDSVRVYIDDDFVEAKVSGSRGGFAVGGFSNAKGELTDNYLFVQDDSTRVWTNGGGGFEIMDLASNATNYLDMTPDNYFIGHESGYLNQGGLYNSCLGYQTGKNNVDGNSNVFMGYQAGLSNINGWSNIFIGNQAGLNNNGDFANAEEGSKNIFMGHHSGMNNTIGRQNLFIGMESGFNNLYGAGNVCIGNSAGYNNNTGNINVFIGPYAGHDCTVSGNVYVGNSAGYFSSTGERNAYIGNQSGQNNTTGSDNTFIGYTAGSWSGTASRNTFIGSMSGNASSDANDNVFVGSEAGKFNVGDYNVFIGSRTGSFADSVSNSIFIGAWVGQNTTTGSNLLYIDNSNTTTPLIQGDFAENKLTINDILQVAPRATAPIPAEAGDIYYDSTDNKLKVYNGTIWENLN